MQIVRKVTLDRYGKLNKIENKNGKSEENIIESGMSVEKISSNVANQSRKVVKIAKINIQSCKTVKRNGKKYENRKTCPYSGRYEEKRFIIINHKERK